MRERKTGRTHRIFMYLLAAVVALAMLPSSAFAARDDSSDLQYVYYAVLEPSENSYAQAQIGYNLDRWLPQDADLNDVIIGIGVNQVVKERGMAVLRGRSAMFTAWVEYEGEIFLAPVDWSVSGIYGGTRITEPQMSKMAGYLYVDPREPANTLTVTVRLSRDSTKSASVTLDVINGRVIYDEVYYDNFHEAYLDAKGESDANPGETQIISILRDYTANASIAPLENDDFLFDVDDFNFTLEAYSYMEPSIHIPVSDGGNLDFTGDGQFNVHANIPNRTAINVIGTGKAHVSNVLGNVSVKAGGVLRVDGNVDVGISGLGIQSHRGGILNVGGNVIGDIYADGGAATVGGNVTGRISAQNYIELPANEPAVIRVKGDVTVVNDEAMISDNAAVYAAAGADITIDGSITKPNGVAYICFYDSEGNSQMLGPNNYSSIDANGYLVYTNSDSIVRVGNHNVGNGGDGNGDGEGNGNGGDGAVTGGGDQQQPPPTTGAGIKVKLPKTKITKVAVGKRLANITFTKLSKFRKVTKYQIGYRYNIGTRWGGWKTKIFTVKNNGAKTAKVTLKKLKTGKKYQFRERALKTVSGKTYYAPWSTTKTSKKIK